jgi:hypothetical protein
MAGVVDKLNRISEPPSQKEDFDTWLEMGSALDFLRDDGQQDDFVVYASNRYSFVHAVLAPASSVNPPDIDDLMSWNCNPASSWGITVQFSEPRSVWISPPLARPSQIRGHYLRGRAVNIGRNPPGLLDEIIDHKNLPRREVFRRQ